MSEVDFVKLKEKLEKKGAVKPRYTLGRFGITAVALLLLSTEMIDDATGLTSLRGKKGLWDFDRKMTLGKYKLSEVIKSLENELLLKRDGNRFYITPKGKRRARLLHLYAPVKMPDEWSGKWYFVIFDIPEDMRDKRNILRSVLRRKGFEKLQNSVFVAPYADFEELDAIRRELEIEKYVNFLVAESAETDDDSLLRKRFGLKANPKKRKGAKEI